MADRMAVQLEETGANGLSREEALVDLRTTLDWLGGDVQYIEAEIDPDVEMCTITKAFDNSKVIVANNIKGYPGVRMISNLYSRKERVCRFHGCEEFRDIKRQLIQQVNNPSPRIRSGVTGWALPVFEKVG